MRYAISDIHGEYDLFMKMLKEIDLQSTDTLYILGDVVDRGEEPIKILQYIMKQPNIKLLLGNHEEFMLEYFKNDCQDGGLWFGNGGGITYEQLMALGQDEMELILNYVRRCKLAHNVIIDGINYWLVHAGLEFDDEGYICETQSRDFMLWARNEFIKFTTIDLDANTVVIFGHTPTVNIHKSCNMWHGNNKNKICIDCGAVFGYQLGCLRLEDLHEFYVSK